MNLFSTDIVRRHVLLIDVCFKLLILFYFEKQQILINKFLFLDRAERDDDPEVTRAKFFIRDEFLVRDIKFFY